MTNPHKWVEVISAYAQGKQIQYRLRNEECWRDFNSDNTTINFNAPFVEWHIKPEMQQILYMTGLFYDPIERKYFVVSLTENSDPNEFVLTRYIKTTGLTFIKFLQNWTFIKVDCEDVT